jgi:hypothetical protein
VLGDLGTGLTGPENSFFIGAIYRFYETTLSWMDTSLFLEAFSTNCLFLKLIWIGDFNFRGFEMIGVTLNVGAKQLIVFPIYQLDAPNTGVLF